MTDGESKNEKRLKDKGFDPKPKGKDAKAALDSLSDAQMDVLEGILEDIKNRAPDESTEAAVSAVGGHNW